METVQLTKSEKLLKSIPNFIYFTDSTRVNSRTSETETPCHVVAGSNIQNAAHGCSDHEKYEKKIKELKKVIRQNMSQMSRMREKMGIYRIW